MQSKRRLCCGVFEPDEVACLREDVVLGDEFLGPLLHAIDWSEHELRTGRMGCINCHERASGSSVVHALAWRLDDNGNPTDVRRAVICERCADGKDHTALYAIAVGSITERLQMEWAAARGGTAVCAIGHA